MNGPQLQILAVLVVTMALFIWGRWRHDLVAMASLLACVLLGLVEKGQAFLGLGHPAVVKALADAVAKGRAVLQDGDGGLADGGEDGGGIRCRRLLGGAHGGCRRGKDDHEEACLDTHWSEIAFR